MLQTCTNLIPVEPLTDVLRKKHEQRLPIKEKPITNSGLKY